MKDELIIKAIETGGQQALELLLVYKGLDILQHVIVGGIIGYTCLQISKLLMKSLSNL